MIGATTRFQTSGVSIGRFELFSKFLPMNACFKRENTGRCVQLNAIWSGQCPFRFKNRAHFYDMDANFCIYGYGAVVM